MARVKRDGDRFETTDLLFRSVFENVRIMVLLQPLSIWVRY